MALLNRHQIQTTQYSSDGSPWVKVTAKSTIKPNTLEYSSTGSPWYGSWDYIKSITGTLWSNIKKIGGVLLINLKTFGNKSNS